MPDLYFLALCLSVECLYVLGVIFSSMFIRYIDTKDKRLINTADVVLGNGTGPTAVQSSAISGNGQK